MFWLPNVVNKIKRFIKLNVFLFPLDTLSMVIFVAIRAKVVFLYFSNVHFAFCAAYDTVIYSGVANFHLMFFRTMSIFIFLFVKLPSTITKLDEILRVFIEIVLLYPFICFSQRCIVISMLVCANLVKVLMIVHSSDKCSSDFFPLYRELMSRIYLIKEIFTTSKRWLSQIRVLFHYGYP